MVLGSVSSHPRLAQIYIYAAALEGNLEISFKTENVHRLLGSTPLFVYLLGKHVHKHTETHRNNLTPENYKPPECPS